MNIIFMGTPEFAVPCLKALIKEGHNIQRVFTQPDRKRNRGQQLQMPPVKEVALANNIEVVQPLSLRKGDDAKKAIELIKKLNPHVIVVVAYGQILPKEILDTPSLGCINVHASLLPKYRGAAPIQWSIVNGETETGITTMYMAEGLDTGDMIDKSVVKITPEMTGTFLHDTLSEMGAKLILQTLDGLENGTATRTPQDDSLSSYAPLIKKDTLKIDFSKPANQVVDFIRGMADCPGAYSFLCGKRLKVFSATVIEGEYDYPAGSLVDLAKFIVVCGDRKAVTLTNIQLEGCRQMSSEECMRGRCIPLYTVLGE